MAFEAVMREMPNCSDSYRNARVGWCGVRVRVHLQQQSV